MQKMAKPRLSQSLIAFITGYNGLIGGGVSLQHLFVVDAFITHPIADFTFGVHQPFGYDVIHINKHTT
jgi:hypothetical protein